MIYSIYVDGAARNNQQVCMRCGVGLVVLGKNNEILHEASIAIDRKTDCAELGLLEFAKGWSMAILSIQIMITA